MNTIQIDFAEAHNTIILGGNTDSRRSLLEGLTTMAMVQGLPLIPLTNSLFESEVCDELGERENWPSLLVVDDSIFSWKCSAAVNFLGRCFALGLLHGIRVLLCVSDLSGFASLPSSARLKILQNTHQRFVGQTPTLEIAELIAGLLPIPPLSIGSLLNPQLFNPSETAWYFLGVSGAMLCQYQPASQHTQPILMFD